MDFFILSLSFAFLILLLALSSDKDIERSYHHINEEPKTNPPQSRARGNINEPPHPSTRPPAPPPVRVVRDGKKSTEGKYNNGGVRNPPNTPRPSVRPQKEKPIC